MSKTNFLLYSLLIIGFLILSFVGYWFYSTQSLKSRILHTIIDGPVTFRYSDYSFGGLFYGESIVTFTKPIFEIRTSSGPISGTSEKIKFSKKLRESELMVENPSSHLTLILKNNKFNCKNLRRAVITKDPENTDAAIFSMLQEGVECDIQDAGDKSLFDLDLKVEQVTNNEGKITKLLVKVDESTRKIDVDLSIGSKNPLNPIYLVDIRGANVATSEYRCNLDGSITLAPGYSGIISGKICLSVKNSAAFFSTLEKNFNSNGDSDEAMKAKKILNILQSFDEPASNTLYVCIKEAAEGILLATEKRQKLLSELF